MIDMFKNTTLQKVYLHFSQNCVIFNLKYIIFYDFSFNLDRYGIILSQILSSFIPYENLILKNATCGTFVRERSHMSQILYCTEMEVDSVWCSTLLKIRIISENTSNENC